MGGDASCVGSRVNKDDRLFTGPELLGEVIDGLLQDGGPCALERTEVKSRVRSAPGSLRVRGRVSGLEKGSEKTHVTYGTRRGLFPAWSSIALRIQARRPRAPEATLFLLHKSMCMNSYGFIFI